MKKLSLFILLTLSGLAFSQNKKSDPTRSSGDKALLIKPDQAELEAKKKSAEEKARLPKPYDPKADAEKDIESLVMKAKEENRNIMIQAGGNWCIWCLRFNNFIQTTSELKDIVDENYLYYHLNYSPDNKNEKVFEKYGNPGEKFGYPVFIVLNKEGELIHVQPSDVLEEGKGYSVEKVKEFFNAWLPERQ
jgi:hypothetical protein